MKGNLLWVLLMVMPMLALPAQGGPFSKKPVAKPDPMVLVPQLLYQVKMDPSEKKRAAAAEELREYDHQKFPEMVSILMDVLQNDKAASVRSEAAHTLGRIRPVSVMMAQALENTSHKDSTMRVRMQAWTSLRMIHLAGAYPALPKENKTPGKDGPVLVTGQGKDGLHKGDAIILIPNTTNNSVPSPVSNINQTPVSNINQTSNIPRPLPSSPSGGFSTAVPTQGLRVNPPTVVDGGPALGPPPR